MIYIYDDQYFNNLHVMRAVQSVCDIEVDFCNARMVENGCLNQTHVLIMPGGADLFYCEKLRGKGNQIIRDFVADGGSYLGTCAGAYYGCSSLDWNKGEIDGERELAFCDVHAVGPVYEWIENPDAVYDGSWKKAINIELDDGSTLTTLYDGGPIFEHCHSIEVIARYADLKDQPPAIIGGQFGKGKYILSSPHIEKFGHLLTDGLYKHRNNSYDREKEVIDTLLPHEQKQIEFFKDILNRLL